MTNTPPPGHPITASVLITDRQDRLLIAHPAKPGAPWALPGSAVELGESPLDAWRWKPPTSVLQLLHPRIAARIVGPLQYLRPAS
ncbi:NUDIX domain-containing protein [Streptomyces sp. NPDC002536]